MPVRRLTQTQYRYTVLDLLGLDALTDGELQQLKAIPDGAVGRFQGSGGLVDEEVVRSYLELGERLADRAFTEGALARWPCALAEATCLTGFVTDFGRRALRRPLSSEEVTTYLALHDELKGLLGSQGAAHEVVATLLSSASFLYRLEPIDPESARGAVVPLDGYALASRLSYFLWSSGPDEALLAAAASGALAKPDAYAQQVSRLLADPRSARSLDEFYSQWLGLEHFETVDSVDPVWTDALKASLRAEPLTFVHQLLEHGQARFSTLLTAPFTYGDATLAQYYGAAAPDLFGRIELDASQRAGVLTMPAVLARYGQSHPEIQRGLFVRDALLCDRPGPPPAGASQNKTANRVVDLPCSGCHQQLDPLGYGFADFDALGRLRPTTQAAAQRASASLNDLNRVLEPALTGPFSSPAELSTRLAQSSRTHHCFITQWLRYAHRRWEKPADACQLGELRERFEESGGDLEQLVADVALAKAFGERALADLTTSVEGP